MKHKQSCPGFELRSPIPFLMTITITQSMASNLYNVCIYSQDVKQSQFDGYFEFRVYLLCHAKAKQPRLPYGLPLTEVKRDSYLSYG